MPKSKKPRKRYNAAATAHRKNVPTFIEAFQMFDPIYRVMEQLEFGEVECVQGRPVFEAHDGDLYEISSAMIGWCDCWQRICDAQGLMFESAPLRKLAKRLECGVPLTIDEVSAARKVIDFTRQVFAKTPVEVLRHNSVTEQIAIEFERLKLKEAA